MSTIYGIRACREGNRNVHAFSIGILTSFKCHNDSALGRLSVITYNPFLNSTFAFITNQQPITTATKVILQHGNAYTTTIDERQLLDSHTMRI